MSYQVIARKWRPQRFEELVGQEPITRTLRNAIENDRLHHAYLFSGARGVGKTTSARLLAKALNCRKHDKPTPDPCDTTKADACESCIEISESRSIDVLEFDAASHTGVDDIRSLILNTINIRPARDRYKIFIIDEIHMLSNSSFNALLKTLEEPPENVVFIMATTEPHKLPDTILSRCQQFIFRTIGIQKILGRLNEIAKAERIDISEGAIREIARSGEGSMRDAQSNFDQVISFSGDRIETKDVVGALGIASAESLMQTIKAIGVQDSATLLNVIDNLVSSGQDLRNYCRDCLALIRDLTVFKVSSNSASLLDSSILSEAELNQLAKPFRQSDLVRMFASISETESKLRNSPEPRYLLEIGMIKLSEMQKLADLEKLAEKINELAQGIEIEDIEDSDSVPTEKEKKTLNPNNPPADVPFPVGSPATQNVGTEQEKENESKSHIASDTAEVGIQTVEPQLVEPDYLRDRFRSESEAEAGIEVGSNSESKNEESKISKKDFDTARFAFNPDQMPVRLEPIKSEELAHIEDKKLDQEYETRLIKEGDSMEILSDPQALIDQLFSRNNDADLESKEADAQPPNLSGRDSRAMSIIADMLDKNEMPEEIPELPPNPTEDDLRVFASNHPSIIKMMQLFSAKLGKVEQEN